MVRIWRDSGKFRQGLRGSVLGVGSGGELGLRVVKMSFKCGKFEISIRSSLILNAAMHAFKLVGSSMRQFALKHKSTCSFMAQQMMIKTNDSTVKHKLVHLNISVHAQCINCLPISVIVP